MEQDIEQNIEQTIEQTIAQHYTRWKSPAPELSSECAVCLEEFPLR